MLASAYPSVLFATASVLVVGCAASPAPMRADEPPPTTAVVGGTDSSCAVGFPEYPCLNPDGTIVVFAWAGDLWSASVQGGACSRLTVHPAEERRSAFSPDGSLLAFESNRDGARNLYVMPVSASPAGLLAGTARRLTASDRAQNLGSFAADGKSLLFTSALEPTVYRAPRMYQVALDGPTEPTTTGGVSGGPITSVTPVFGNGVRAGADGLWFVRGYAPPERPKYRGSGQCEIWKMTTDGKFAQISTNPANEYEPCPLPDGSTLFISSRDGQNNVWRVGPGGESEKAAIQLTSFKPGADQLTIGAGVRDLAVSANGKVAVFCVWDRMYRLDLTDPKAMPVAVDLVAQADDVTREVQRLTLDKEVSEVALSPDGKTLALVARGEVFVRNTGEGYPTRRVTNTPGRERDLAWSPDGRVLYFSSDDEGLGNGTGEKHLGKYAVYAASVDLAREDIAPEKKKDEEKKDDAADKKKEDEKPAEPKAEKKEEEKKDDAKSDDKKDEKKDEKSDKSKPKKPDFGKRWAEALRFRIESVASDKVDVRHPNPSPDAKCLLVTRGLGDLVLIELEHSKQRVLFTGWNEPDVEWAADSRNIVYAVEDLDFNSDIWLLDTGGFDSFDSESKFKQGEPLNLTRHPDNDGSPRLSADGKVLTFLSERGEENDQVDVYQVYLDKELEGMTPYERDDYYKKAGEAGGKRKPVETPAFVLAALKAKGDRAVMPKPGEKKEEKKDEAVGGAKDEPKKDGEKKDDAKIKPAKKAEPLKFDADDAYLRIRRITTGGSSKSSLQVTPGADRIIFAGTFDTESQLVSIDHKGADRKTITPGPISDVSISLTGDKVAFVKAGTASTSPPIGGKITALPIDAPVAIDIAAQQRQKFLEAARTFGDRFYHPTMKGLDWEGLTKRYVTLAVKTRTAESFNRVTQFLLGETEGSHTGINGGGTFSTPAPATGYIGVRVKPAVGGYEVVNVTPQSPASLKQSRIFVGDVIVAVDSKRLAPDDNSQPTLDLDAALMGRSGRETLVELKRAATSAGEAKKEAAKEAEKQGDQPKPEPPPGPFVVITPVNSATWTKLRYDEEILARRALVEKLSNGKIGYLHIRAMAEAEVRDYERDLYAAGNGKQALIIDVRDNGGGSTADVLLTSLTAPLHAYTAPRGADLAKVPHDAYPRDRRLIYAWTRPLDVLINEHSFSNAEIFAHAIHTMHRGRLVGTPTFGGVISTGAFTLIDGTTVRMPFRGWYLPDGTDMENHGAQPDVNVPQTPSDEAAGKDPQLEAAVGDLMKQVGR